MFTYFILFDVILFDFILILTLPLFWAALFYLIN